MSALGRLEQGAAREPIPRPAVELRPVKAQPRRLRSLLLIAADIVTLSLAAGATTYFYAGTLTRTVGFGDGPAMPLAAACELVFAWWPFLALQGVYSPGLSWGSGEFRRSVRAIAMGTALYVLLRFVLHLGMPPRLWTVAAWMAASTALVLERLVIRRFTSRMHARGHMLRRTLVVGTNTEAAHVVESLQKRHFDGFAPVGCLASSLKDRLSLDYTAPIVPTLGNARDLPRVVAEHDVDAVIVVSSAFDHEVLERIIFEVSHANVDIYLSSSLTDVLLSRLTVREVAGIPLISLRGISLSPGNLLLKRTFDIVGATAVILAGMPLWLVVAALIKLTSPGPVFYRQERIGLRGRPFMMFKFRSMEDGADTRLAALSDANERGEGPLFKMRADPRVTAVGKWLRRFSIDEFPQLINVLRGEMSMVGPRPPLAAETRYYEDYEWQRLEVVPGMTGLWQVSGRSDLTFQEMVSLDLFYIGNWQLALDLSILLRTIPAVLNAKGAW